MLLWKVWKLLREAPGKGEKGKSPPRGGEGTDIQSQVPGLTGPPSSAGKSHPWMHSNTHPLTEKWQSRASLKILGVTVGRSQEKRIAGNPHVLGGGEVRTDEGRGREMGQEM